MIYFVRSARIGPGSQGGKLAREIAKYINEHYPEANLELLTNLSGHLGQVHWVSKYKSMAAAEEVKAKLAADEGWKVLLKPKEGEVTPKFTDMNDAFYNIVEDL